MFDVNIREELLKNEVGRIFAHPLAPFIFLSTLQAPVIDGILNRHIKQIQKRLFIRHFVEKIQSNGGTTKGLKEYYFKINKSRQTYYNHLRAAKELMRQVCCSELEQLTASKIHSCFLSQFGLGKPMQEKLF